MLAIGNPRTVTFRDGSNLTSRLTDEALAYQHGWKILRDETRDETVFVGWRWTAVECSDGEMYRERWTAAIANAETVRIYAF